MRVKARQVFEFGPFRLDAADRQLWKDGTPLRLPPKLFDTLVVLVRHAGRAVSKDTLMAEVWPGTFVEEGNLKVNVSTLRKMLDDGSGREYVETVPKLGYRFSATLREVLIEETGPEVVPVSAPDAALRPIEAVRSSRLRRVWPITAAAIVVLSAGLWALWRSRESAVPPSVQALAVLPFETLGGDERDAYLGLGMADALITRLGSLGRFRLSSTAAVRRYQRPNVDPLAAGRELGADAVLTGTLQRDGERLRLRVQLARVSDGVALWGDRYDELIDDIFTLQDTVAERMAASLVANITEDERTRLRSRQQTSHEVYELYLKGRYYWNRRTPESIAAAVTFFSQAIAEDPGFALGYAGLADAYAISASGLPPLERFPKAKAAALRALQLDDQLAEAHTALAFLTYKSEWKWVEAERSFRRALELNPSYALAHHWFGEFLYLLGRTDEALGEYRMAVALDPYSPAIRADMSTVLIRAKRVDEAGAVINAGLRVEPRDARLYSALAGVRRAEGRDAEAVKLNLEARTLSGVPEGEIEELRAAWRQGGMPAWQRREIEVVVRQLRPGTPAPVGIASVLAPLYAQLGEIEPALRWLQVALDERGDAVLRFRTDRRYDPIRHDPRFQALAAKVGIP
jgi:DNA-binding winged helix-turn-helix (wHTH) protein/TolB-like protein/tetratricopeptide (TPR) repeat protein